MDKMKFKLEKTMILIKLWCLFYLETGCQSLEKCVLFMYKKIIFFHQNYE